jgi:glutathione synthase/RimK-type ligase-like ATP-grasp enzyme
MILLWGLPGDAPIANVQRALARRNCSAFFLDERDTLNTRIEVSSADARHGILSTRYALVDLATITAVYQRPYGLDRLPALEKHVRGDAAWHYAQTLQQTITTWLEITPALVVNTTSSMASNGSKPYQAQIIAAHGLRVPETLVTTDADAAREFLGRHGELVYKSTSSVRSIVSRLSSDKLDRLDLLRWCPTQFQEYIAGDDYRVHVVGNEVFSCRVVSTVDDYRYASRQQRSVDILACEIPDHIADACRRVTRTLDLCVAGVDLRLHPTRGWYCFEVNPSPAFAYFENASGLEIGESIANLLIRAEAR